VVGGRGVRAAPGAGRASGHLWRAQARVCQVDGRW
jgi:hypothetical protein